MGIASYLFYDEYDGDAQTLIKRIVPTPEQFEEQQDRWNELATHLIDDLAVRSDLDIRTWLQGSYKFGTQVRPPSLNEEFDIDLGVYFCWSGDPEDGDYSPSELTRMVQASLEAYDAEGVVEVVSPPKPRCSRIRFTGDFHIDVPAYHLDARRDRRTLATNKNQWEDSDPKALLVWFRSLLDEVKRPIARRQIRYFKAWAGLKFFNDNSRPSSTLLTVLVAEAVSEIDLDAFEDDDDLLLEILESIVPRLQSDRVVPNPDGVSEENLAARLSDQDFDAFLEKLKTFRDNAADALDADDLVTAADHWSESFEHFFPMPSPELLAEAMKGDRQLPVVQFTPDVAVTAVSQSNQSLIWRDTNKIGPIPKGCDIRFELANAAVLPIGALVTWMVRNEGFEAEYKNDLGHVVGTGLRVERQSAYRGTHFMDCVVKLQGRVIGVRRVPVTITGMFAPRRTPLRRPGWLKHRGKR